MIKIDTKYNDEKPGSYYLSCVSLASFSSCTQLESLLRV